MLLSGVQKNVLNNSTILSGCFHCTHCIDTGHSFICNLTNEKLEGFTTEKDKKENNVNELLQRNILIGVGNNCPLPVIHEKKLSKIKHNVSLEEIEKFINSNESEMITSIEDKGLIVTAHFFNDGFESNEEFMSELLSDVIDKVEDRFNCNIEFGESGDDFDSVIITL